MKIPANGFTHAGKFHADDVFATTFRLATEALSCVRGGKMLWKAVSLAVYPGELITVEQIAPLGDPISISVAGYSLSLRNDEAEGIIVTKQN